MTDKRRRYLSYLLRLWQEWDRLPAVWRASLEDPQTGERLGFSDIVQLFTFLEDQVSDETEHRAHNPPDDAYERSEVGLSEDAQTAQTRKDRRADSRAKPRQ